MEKDYKDKTGINASVFVSRPAPGTMILKSSSVMAEPIQPDQFRREKETIPARFQGSSQSIPPAPSPAPGTRAFKA